MPRKDGNHRIVKKLLVAMGLGAAGAISIPLAAAAAVVAEVIHLAGRRDAEADTREIMTEIRAGRAWEDTTTLYDTIVKAAGLKPEYATALDGLVAAQEDLRDKGKKRRELFEKAVKVLFTKTGPTADPEQFGRLVIERVVNAGVYIEKVSDRHSETGGIRADHIERVEYHEHIHDDGTSKTPSAEAQPTRRPYTGVKYPVHDIEPGSREVVDPFCGRASELGQIQQAVAAGDRIVAVVGMPGQGKSALIGRWYDENLAYLTGKAVFWCSPYQRSYTFDVFLEHVLEYLTDGQFDPRELPTTRERAERLCKLLRTQPVLIVTDGIERWLALWEDDDTPTGQGATVAQRKGAADGLDMFFRDVVNWSDGATILLTSRALPSVLDHRRKTLISSEECAAKLGGLDDAAAIELLREIGVKGDDDALLSAASEYSNHPWSVCILGSLLVEGHGGNIAKRPKVNVPDE